MNSRYGFWLMSICLVSLAGCANWQNRQGPRAPGSAASLAPAPAPLSNGPLLNAPGSTFGEPPPPMPPPPMEPNSTLAPLDNGPRKLDLSSAPSSSAPAVSSNKPASIGKLYNLEKSAPSKSVASSSSKSSAISKLASKAAPARKTEEAASTGSPSLSTLARLSANAENTNKPEPAAASPVAAVEAAPAPAPVATNTEALPAPTVEAKAQPAADSEALDTTLLAAPVRKGSDSEKSEKESKGPQSNLVPSVNLFKDNGKPVIYPVSNPASDEPVSLVKFS